MSTEILIHANTGTNVGLGHLVRCITLAKELRSRNVATELRLKPDDGAIAFARKEGVQPTISAPATLRCDLSASTATTVIVDSYEFIGEDFEQLADGKTLVVIDELGDRRTPADLVVNNNIYADEIDYPAADTVLRGPEYCMLREPFREMEPSINDHPPESLLVTIGGADLAESFVEILDVTSDVVSEATIDAIVGPYFDVPEEVPDNVVFHREPSNIHDLMLEADAAVSGGGQTLYELAACGTPAVALTLGADQVRNISGFEAANCCLAAGDPDAPAFEKRLRSHLNTLCDDAETRRRMSERGRTLVDGHGASRVADEVVRAS